MHPLLDFRAVPGVDSILILEQTVIIALRIDFSLVLYQYE